MKNLPVRPPRLQALAKFAPSGPRADASLAHLSGAIGLIEFVQSMGNPKGGYGACWVMAQVVNGRKNGALAFRVEQSGGFVQ